MLREKSWLFLVLNSFNPHFDKRKSCFVLEDVDSLMSQTRARSSQRQILSSDGLGLTSEVFRGIGYPIKKSRQFITDLLISYSLNNLFHLYIESYHTFLSRP